jgi:GNAT superfamily N-acetyltransferase
VASRASVAVPVHVVELDDPKQRSSTCEAILHALPGWFGLETANEAYIRDVAALPTFAARRGGTTLGFLSLKLHTSAAAEIYVMGVLPSEHRRGIGSALVRAAELWLETLGVEYLQVKTLGPSHPSERYAGTRKFYERIGFRPLEELTAIWGVDNPCLILLKHLGRR